jgi:hypothetical protein
MKKEFPQGKKEIPVVIQGTLKTSKIPIKITFDKLEHLEIFRDFYNPFKRELYFDFVGLINPKIAKIIGGIAKSERFLRDNIQAMSYYLYAEIKDADFEKLSEPIKSFLKKSGLDGSEDKLYRETFFVASLINYAFSGWLKKNLISFANIKERDPATKKIIKKTPVYSEIELKKGFEPKSFNKTWINGGRKFKEDFQMKEYVRGFLFTIKKTEPAKTPFVHYLLKTIPKN